MARRKLTGKIYSAALQKCMLKNRTAVDTNNFVEFMAKFLFAYNMKFSHLHTYRNRSQCRDIE